MSFSGFCRPFMHTKSPSCDKNLRVHLQSSLFFEESYSIWAKQERTDSPENERTLDNPQWQRKLSTFVFKGTANARALLTGALYHAMNLPGTFPLPLLHAGSTQTQIVMSTSQVEHIEFVGTFSDQANVTHLLFPTHGYLQHLAHIARQFHAGRYIHRFEKAD